MRKLAGDNVIVWQSKEGIFYSGLLGQYRYRIKDFTQVERQDPYSESWESVSTHADLKESMEAVRKIALSNLDKAKPFFPS